MLEEKKNLCTLPGVLVFELSGKQFCADIRDFHSSLDLSEINGDEKLTLSKKTYFNYHNRQIPILNFHKLFKLTHDVLQDNIKVMFFEHDETMICFVADRIVEFIAFDDRKTAQQLISKSENYPYAGTIYYDGKTFLFPDYSEIIIEWKNSNNPSIHKRKKRVGVMPGKNTLPP